MSSAKCKIVSRLETPLPIVDGDADRLFQVISNLLNNAVKYSPDGGEVLITTSHGDGHVRISVKDHGVGIPQTSPASSNAMSVSTATPATRSRGQGSAL